VGRALRPALGYALKLLVLSFLAGLPLLALRAPLAALFAGRSRLIQYGLPLAVSGLIYAALGLGLLLATGDPQLRAIIRMLRRRGK
jgi:hypothetical protein